MNTVSSHPWTSPLEGLPLRVATPREWVAIALEDLDALLVDHAHCEQKAASVALSLIGRFPEDAAMVRAMIALAHEEMRHFRQVLDRIEARGVELTKPRPDRYVRRLREWSFRHRGGIGSQGDLYLASAFVEARSCERFRLLAEGLTPEPELALFYARLADAEGRHWESFRDLAFTTAPAEAVERRLGEMAQAEGEIVSSLPLAPRMH